MSNKIAQSQKRKKNDVIYTPEPVARLMISMCELKQNESVLDPCRGGGVFYNNFPSTVKKYWDEIADGKDFLKRKKHIDVIVGNPPYSLWDKWIEHTLNICDNRFCYIFGFLNFNEKRLGRIIDAGFGLVRLHLLSVDYWFGRSLIAVFQKNKPSIMSFSPSPFMCDVCGGRCGRGRNGRSFNVCGKEK